MYAVVGPRYTVIGGGGGASAAATFAGVRGGWPGSTIVPQSFEFDDRATFLGMTIGTVALPNDADFTLADREAVQYPDDVQVEV